MRSMKLLLAPLPEIVLPLGVVLVVDKWGQSKLDRAKWYVESNGQVGARAAEGGKCSA